MKKFIFWGGLLLTVFVIAIMLLGAISHVMGYKWRIVDEIGAIMAFTMLVGIIISAIVTFIAICITGIKRLWQWANR